MEEIKNTKSCRYSIEHTISIFSTSKCEILIYFFQVKLLIYIWSTNTFEFLTDIEINENPPEKIASLTKAQFRITLNNFNKPKVSSDPCVMCSTSIVFVQSASACDQL